MKFSNLSREMNEENFSRNMDEIDTVLRNIDFANNMFGDIVTIKNVPTGNFTIGHKLKSVPKYRIILRQSNGGQIVDQSTKPWTDKEIYLKNDGASVIDQLTLFIGG